MGEEKEYIIPIANCHHQNDSCIKMGSDESRVHESYLFYIETVNSRVGITCIPAAVEEKVAQHQPWMTEQLEGGNSRRCRRLFFGVIQPIEGVAVKFGRNCDAICFRHLVNHFLGLGVPSFGREPPRGLRENAVIIVIITSINNNTFIIVVVVVVVVM